MKNDFFENWMQDQNELTILLVDIHKYTQMVTHPESIMMSEFTHDVFIGSVNIIEKNNGLIINTMGDAFLAIFKNSEEAFFSSWSIIRDFWKQHEYLTDDVDSEKSKTWPFIQNGLYCRCAIEKGIIEYTSLHVSQGEFLLWTGKPIIYATRILNFPENNINFAQELNFDRNTLIVGPNAYKNLCSYKFLDKIEKEVKKVKYIGYPFDTRLLWGD